MIVPLVNFVVGVLAAEMCREYARQRYQIGDQLLRFSCDNAQCWCCEVGHLHPDTMENVNCDRELVYAAIDTWFDGGRAAFEHFIRHNMANEVDQSFGGLLRYGDVLRLAVPQLWLDLFLFGRSCEPAHTIPVSLLEIAGKYFSWSAFSIACLIWISAILRRRLSSCDWTINAMVGMVWTGLDFITRPGFIKVDRYVSLIVSVIVFILGHLMIRGLFLPQSGAKQRYSFDFKFLTRLRLRGQEEVVQAEQVQEKAEGRELDDGP